ncbi:uncharacterized protein LOC102808147 [Saccoglossus kowalevskii]
MTGDVPDVSRFQLLDRLDLNRNNLKGSLADILNPNMTYLQNITLSFNDFSGTLDDVLIQNMPLHFVQLSMNTQINGTLPRGLCDKVNLTVLSVGETNISGSIPGCLGYNTPRLRFVDFEYTRMRSRFPESLTYLQELQSMHISEMGLYGDFPSTFGYNYSIVVDFVAANNELTGEIPEGIKYMTGLERLDISYNNLSGCLPTELVELPLLTRVVVKGNSFTSLPPGASFTGGNLHLLDLSENPYLRVDFSVVMHLIQNSTALNWLNISHTGIHGPLDRKLYNFEYLNCIDLSHNYITGRIPDTRVDMPFLTIFDLSFNRLTGSVPGTYVILSTLRFLDVHGNNKMRSFSPRVHHDDGLFVFDMDQMMTIPNKNYSCPSVRMKKRNYGVCNVILDPVYYFYDHCTCNEHFYGNAGYCEPCLPHGTCKGKQVNATMEWKTNFWPAPSLENVTTIEECITTQTESPACNSNGNCTCWLGVDAATGRHVTKCDSSCVCQENHKGRLCLECKNSSFYLNGHSCRPCYDGQNKTYKALIVITSVTVFLVLLAWFLRWRYGRQRFEHVLLTTALQIAALAANLILCAVGRAPFWGFQLTLIVVVGNLSGIAGNAQGILNGFVFYIQLLEAILRTYPVAPFEVYKALIFVKESFNFQFQSMACLIPLMFKPPFHLLMTISVPVMCIAAIGVLIAIGAGWNYYRIRRFIADPANAQLLQPNAGLDWRPFENFCYKCGGVAIFLLNVMYFPIVKQSLMALTICDVDKATGKLYMHNYPTIPCEGVLWIEIFLTSICALVIYGIIMPVCFGVLLAKYMPTRRRIQLSNIQTPEMLRRLENIQSFLGKFFRPYKDMFEYVEIGYLFRKLCLAILLSCIPRGTVMQPFAVAAVFAIALQLQLRYRPYQGDLENRLEEFALWILLFTSSCAGFLYLASVDLYNIPFAEFVIFSFVALNLLVFFAYVIALIARLCKFCERERPQAEVVDIQHEQPGPP